MDIQSLYKALNHYKPQLYKAEKKCSGFTSIKFLVDSFECLDPCILYICNASYLTDKLNLLENLNIICIMNCEIPEEELLASNSSIITICDNVSIMSFFNEVYDIVFIRQNINEGKKKTIDAFVIQEKFGDVLEISEIAHEVLKNPLIIYSSDGGLIAGKHIESIPNMSERKLKNLLKSKFENFTVTSEESNNLVSNKVTRNVFGSNYNVIIGNIISDGETVAHMMTIEVERAFNEEDVEVVSEFSKSISLEKNKKPSNDASKTKKLFDKLIINMLEGNIELEKIITTWSKYTKYSLKGFHNVLTIDITSLKSTTGVSTALKTLPGIRVIQYGSRLVLFTNTRRSDFAKYVEYNALLKILKKYKLEAGLCRSYTRLEETNAYYNQSLKANELGQISNKKEQIYVYDDYVIYHMLDMLPSGIDIIEFCHPGLLELIEYDRLNNTQYTQTLYVLLLVKGKQVDASNELHIHRSTMVYRMEKIEELTGLNAYELKDIVRLYFSFIILKTLNLLDPKIYKGIF